MPKRSIRIAARVSTLVRGCVLEDEPESVRPQGGPRGIAERVDPLAVELQRAAVEPQHESEQVETGRLAAP